MEPQNQEAPSQAVDAAPGLAPENANGGADALDIDANQFVTFMVNNEMFAVPMAPVQEIIRVPEVVRVPLSPPSLKGLANLRGKVLPVVSLRSHFHYEEKEYDEVTRVLVIDEMGTSIGFIVDLVSSVVTVEPQQIEDVSTIQATVNTDLLKGVIKNMGSAAMVMILDFDRLIKSEFAALAQMAKREGARYAAGEAARGAETAGNGADEDELQMVSFLVAGQEYAIAIEQVQEIVQVPEQISRVPHSESHVLGVMTLRNRLLPLVSLRTLFGLPAGELDEHYRVVVISPDDSGRVSVGVVMDSVNEVLRVSKNVVDEMPQMLARNANMVEITSICRLDEGKRLVSILNPEKMFSREVLDSISNSLKQSGGDVETKEREEQGAGSGDDEHMVVFRLGSVEYGVPIESVNEIVRVPDELTHVPKAPHFIEGVINLRGNVLPVVDQRRRFGLDSIARNERQRIMVFTLNGVRTGFIVDSVAEVLKIAHKNIEPAPNLSEEQSRLIQRVANLEKAKRMVLLLEASQILDDGEISALNGVGQ